MSTVSSCVGDPDPYIFGLPDPHPDPLVTSTDPPPDPAPDPDPSDIKQKIVRKTLIFSSVLWLLYDFYQCHGSLTLVSSHEVEKLNEYFGRKKMSCRLCLITGYRQLHPTLISLMWYVPYVGFYKFSLNKFDTVLLTSVGCLDPHDFGPPGPVSTRYGSGSFFHQATFCQKNLDSYPVL